MIERRGFLSLLGLAGAASFLPDVLVTEKMVPRVGAELYTPTTLEGITQAISDEFEKVYASLYGKSIVVGVDPVKLGSEVETVLMSEQLNVGLSLGAVPWEGVRERYIMPAAHVLAEKCAQRKINVFGHLSEPGECVSATVGTDRSVIRGVSQYDMYSDAHVMRFDIIGGHA